MWFLALLPFFLQAIAIFIDEFHFHIKRGLPKWERIGHPVDTATVILCMGMVLFVPYTDITLKIYCALAALSCLMVTKDEFVHKHFCPASENWLHAVLFTLHPLTLITTGFIWPVVQDAAVPKWLTIWLTAPLDLNIFLKIQFSLMILFFIYQVVFWNFIWKEKIAIKY